MPRKSSAMVRPARRSVRRIKGKGDYRVGSMVRTARPRRLKGHGDYSYDNPGPFGRAGSWIGDALGRSFAGEGGGKLGAKLGSYLHYIGKIFGSGDYVTAPNQVKKNVLVSDTQIPQFGSDSNTVHIRHREFLGDVISSGTANTFQTQSFNLNPGLKDTFPWLSQVCGASFQQYRINGMVFEFRTMSADALNSVNTALGSVVMATDYDSADMAFNSKAQMENTEFGVSCKPSSCMIHAIECAKSQTTATELYVRAGAAQSGTDIRLYDWGKFYIATTGCQGTSVNLGELWVSYDITFFKAIQQPAGWLIPSAHYYLDVSQVGTKPVQPATTAQVAALVAAGDVVPYDNIGITFDANGVALYLPTNLPLNSEWMITINNGTNAGGAANASQIVPIFSQGLTALPLYQGGNGNAWPNPTPGTAVRSVGFVYYFYVSAPCTIAAPFKIAVGAPTTPLVSYVASDLVINMINPNMAL
nr:putative capsid protein [Crucivirus sp.]